MGKQPTAKVSRRGGTSPSGGAADSPQSMIDELLKLYQAPAGKGTPGEITDAVTQALVLQLGSGPSTAGLQSMTAASEALARVFHDAVAQQQKINIEALAVTADCVRNILGAAAPAPSPTAAKNETKSETK